LYLRGSSKLLLPITVHQLAQNLRSWKMFPLRLYSGFLTLPVTFSSQLKHYINCRRHHFCLILHKPNACLIAIQPKFQNIFQ